MNEKPKVDKPRQSRINRYGFLLLWVGAQVLGWSAYFLIDKITGYPLYTLGEWLQGLIIGFVIGAPTAIAQKISLYLYFGRWFRGWIRANSIAWALGGISIMLASDLGANSNEQLGIFIQVLSLMLLPTLAQIWILRRYVQRVWLWLLAAVAGTSVFAAVFGQIGASNTSAFPAFGLYALVTGLSLLWMMGMQGELSKQKISKTADFGRLEDGREERDEPDGILSARDGVKSAEND